MPNCSECGKHFDSDQGVRVHISRSHKELSAILKRQNQANKISERANSNAPVQPSTRQSADQQNGRDNADQSTGETCAICFQHFETPNGLRTHMASHPMASNRTRAARVSPTETQEPPGQSNEHVTDPNDDKLADQCEKWQRGFERMSSNTEDLDLELFDLRVREFLRFLFEAAPKLPGPKHPSTKYYEKRKKRQLAIQSAGHSRSSNPQRTDKKAKERRLDQYHYEVAQYEYYHLRKRVARRAMGENSYRPCPIAMSEMKSHFESIFSTPNEHTLSYYPTRAKNKDIEISVDDVNAAIQSTSLDTSPDHDRVLIKTIRDLKAGATIKAIMDIMLATGRTPAVLSEGRTIPIFKGGDPENISNYRPITIYPIVRRIIEKVADRHLRKQIDLDHNQRGFMNLPGCHINAKLVNGCILDAKENKSDCVVAFLDVSKAFDRVGHRHIEMTLESFGISPNLNRLILSLLNNNIIRLSLGRDQSEPIPIRRSVPQGGPLSPILFNLAIDFIYRDACDPQFAERYGYKLSPDHAALSLSGFADDQAVTSSTVEGAVRLTELVQSHFREIGLEINPKKSTAIVIEKGRLIPGDIRLNDGSRIRCLAEDERIAYLGSTFMDELAFDPSIMDQLTKNLNNLIEYPHLQRDQKLNIINQYILPKLIFPLQAAPIRKIPKQFLDNLDITIRQSAKAAIGLPIHNTPNCMIYSPRRYRGLGLICARKEVLLQHFAIAKRLSTVDDELFHQAFNCAEEMAQCKADLGLEGETTKQLRDAFREHEFLKWTQMSYAGIGVKNFKIFPRANKFIYDKEGLSNAEWVAALKINCGYANLAGVPGTQAPNRQCRHCGETETISHVLGACEFGSTRRTVRHHRLKHGLATLLREAGYYTLDEVACEDDKGSRRYIDILAFETTGDRALIVDPTIRMETNGDQDTTVQEEKSSIYQPCIADLEKRYGQLGKRKFEVIGLWMGSRGTVGHSLIDFFERFGLPKVALPILAVQVLQDSLAMIHSHIYVVPANAAPLVAKGT